MKLAALAVHVASSLRALTSTMAESKLLAAAAAIFRKVTEKFTSQTPRLFAKFNYCVKWFDGWENHKLNLDNYLHGPSAPYEAWVLLKKEE